MSDTPDKTLGFDLSLIEPIGRRVSVIQCPECKRWYPYRKIDAGIRRVERCERRDKREAVK